MKRRMLLIAALALLLTGCGPAYVRPGVTPTLTFHLPISWQTAYQRASDFAWQCHGKTHFAAGTGFVKQNRFPASKQARIVTSGALIPGPAWEQIDIYGEGPNQTRVRIAERDVGPWPRRMMGAALRSIRTGQTICQQDISIHWHPADAKIPVNMSSAPWKH